MNPDAQQLWRAPRWALAVLLAVLVMHSTVALAAVSLAMMCVGLIAWVYLHRRWPDIGRTVAHASH